MSREGYTVDVRCEACGQSMATRRLIPDGFESYRVEVPPCEHCQKQSTEKAKNNIGQSENDTLTYCKSNID
jgi:hypothetical protein